jgi:hypothetical protein
MIVLLIVLILLFNLSEDSRVDSFRREIASGPVRALEVPSLRNERRQMYGRNTSANFN